MPVWLPAQIETSLNRVVDAWSRFVGNSVEHHARFLHALGALAVITGATAGDNVVPRVPATATAGNHVIDGQISAVISTILARVVIANENLAPAQFDAWARASYEGPESNDRGRLKSTLGGVQSVIVLLEHISLATKYEHKGPSNVAHVQRFIVLVQYQDGGVHPAEPFRIRFAAAPHRTRHRLQPLLRSLSEILANVFRNTKVEFLKYLL